MSRSEAVVMESLEIRELLRFLFYLDILNKLLLLQCKHSKYMYAKCLNFLCFINYLAACMHAFCMFHMYVSLGLTLTNYCKIFASVVFCKIFARVVFFAKFLHELCVFCKSCLFFARVVCFLQNFCKSCIQFGRISFTMFLISN